MRQKIAACFAAFVTDDGAGSAIGEQSTTDELVETFEPGMIQRLTPGKNVVFGNPPTVTESGFDTRNLRRVAAGLGVSYEDLTGDYSQSNFSSARMSRLAHWGNVRDWQWNMMIPILCQGVWSWAMDAAVVAGELAVPSTSEWITPAMPMIEPDKEGLAAQRLVRTGVQTFSQMVREQGGDPVAHFAEYAADLKMLDAAGIQLDTDVRKVSQAGLTQQRVGFGSGDSSSSDETPPAKPAAKKRDAEEFDIDEDIPDDIVRAVLA
jgi:lambda family phage portal protein